MDKTSGARPANAGKPAKSFPGAIPEGFDTDNPATHAGGKLKGPAQPETPLLPASICVIKQPSFTSLRSVNAPSSLGEGVSLEKDYVRGKLIGQSSEARVYLLKSTKGKEVFALRVLRRKAESSDPVAVPASTLLHLSKIHHPHIVFCPRVDIVEPDFQIWQVLEFCNGGSLWDFVSTLKEKAPVILVLQCFIQLAEALAYLGYGLTRQYEGHWEVDPNFTSPIIHSDLNLNNVLLHFGQCVEYGMPDLLVADFGMSTTADSPRKTAGTPQYYCPEVVSAGRGISSAPPMSIQSDVYTFGLTMYALIMRELWPPALPPCWLKLPPVYDQLGITNALRRCLEIKPDARPTMNNDPDTGLLGFVDVLWEKRQKMFMDEGPPDRSLFTRMDA